MSLPVNVQQMIDTMPLLRDLEMAFEQVGAGVCRCSLPIAPRLVNPHGGLHGGMTFTLADTGMGFAIYSLLAPDEHTTTISMSIRYLKPAKGERITAHCRVVQRGKKLATTQAEILDDAGEKVALADGSFYISRRRRE
ncbi:MAG: PaaI family thioesterase [Anaerolineales bacterium]